MHTPTPPGLVLDSALAIDLLRRAPGRLLGAEAVRVEVSALGPEARARWAERLGRFRKECGGLEGAAAALLALLGSVFYWTARDVSFGAPPLVVTAAVIVGTSLAGKALALALARRQLRRELGALLAEIARIPF
jgi:hypothetical protein